MQNRKTVKIFSLVVGSALTLGIGGCNRIRIEYHVNPDSKIAPPIAATVSNDRKDFPADAAKHRQSGQDASPEQTKNVQYENNVKPKVDARMGVVKLSWRASGSHSFSEGNIRRVAVMNVGEAVIPQLSLVYFSGRKFHHAEVALGGGDIYIFDIEEDYFRRGFVISVGGFERARISAAASIDHIHWGDEWLDIPAKWGDELAELELRRLRPAR